MYLVLPVLVLALVFAITAYARKKAMPNVDKKQNKKVQVFSVRNVSSLLMTEAMALGTTKNIIFIGSGIANLVCATLLARLEPSKHTKIIILEQHPEPNGIGGTLHTFTRTA